MRNAPAVLLAIFVATAASGATTFVSPLAGAQAIGPMALEVATTATLPSHFSNK